MSPPIHALVVMREGAGGAAWGFGPTQRQAVEQAVQRRQALHPAESADQVWRWSHELGALWLYGSAEHIAGARSLIQLVGGAGC